MGSCSVVGEGMKGRDRRITLGDSDSEETEKGKTGVYLRVGDSLVRLLIS